MKDIKKSTGSGSRSSRIPIIRGEAPATRRLRDYDRQISSRVEEFERGGDIYAQRRRVIKQKKTWRLEIYTGLFLAAIVLIGYILTYIFNSAVVSITPRSIDIAQNSLITFNNQDNAAFEIYELSDAASLDIKKSNSVDVKSKAKGVVTIYNNYNDKPQKLVKNTRLQTADGKIYRIDSAVVVPGKTGDTPGSVKVTAYSDTYGSEYNIDITQMTVPGFKGTAKYNGFYAKNDAKMTGGDMGKRYVISSQDLKDAEAKLAPELESNLREKMLAYNDGDFVAVKDSLTFVYTNNHDQLSRENELKSYEQKVTAKMIVLKRSDLAKRLAALHMSDYNGSDNVIIDNIDDLKINMTEDTMERLASNTVTLSVEYKGSLKWQIDMDNIKKELAGKSMADFSVVMGKYTGVDTAKPTLNPMWSRAFPNSISKINVELE